MVSQTSSPYTDPARCSLLIVSEAPAEIALQLQGTMQAVPAGAPLTRAGLQRRRLPSIWCLWPALSVYPLGLAPEALLRWVLAHLEYPPVCHPAELRGMDLHVHINVPYCSAL